MKKILLLFFLVSVTLVNAQVMGDVYDDEGDGRKLNQVEFERAKVLHDEMIKSDDFLEKNKLFNELLLKVNDKSYPQTFIYDEENINEQKIQNWVERNVPPKNKKKATKLLSRIVFLNNKIKTENSEIIQILKYKASFGQCQEITNPKLRGK
jgi:hypothetical protein